MKRCPTCDRTYADDTTTFCLADGSLLSAPYDPDATQRISGLDTSPPPTLLLNTNPPSQPSPYYSPPAHTVGRKSSTPLYLVITLLLLVGGIGIFLAVRSSQKSQPSSNPVSFSSANTANSAKPSESKAPTDYLRSPWLGLEVWQDGKAAGLFKVDLRRTRVGLSRQPFEIRVPRLKGDPKGEPPVLVVAWTNDSIFSQISQGDKVDKESDSYFNPYKSMADTPAGSGTLMLNEDANYIYDEDRLKPISDSQSTILISSIMNGSDNEHSLRDQKDDLYLVVFRDLNHNEKADNGEYEFLILDF